MGLAGTQRPAAGWTVPAVHAVPSRGGDAGGCSSDHVSARALRAAQHPAGVLREIPRPLTVRVCGVPSPS